MTYKLSNFSHPTIVTDNLILHLDAGNASSYPGTGTTWTDLSGNGNHGALTNGPTFDSANGGSLTFDGSNDLMDLNSSLNLSTNSGFTMCLFLQQNTTQSNSAWNYFYSKASPVIEVGAYGTSGTTFYFKDFSTNSTVTSGDVVSSWSYIAFGTIQTTRTPFIQTFNSSGSFSSTSPTAFSNTTIGFQRLFSAGTGGAAQYYGAKCAIIQAYNRALTASEIQQNFNALRGRFSI